MRVFKAFHWTDPFFLFPDANPKEGFSKVLCWTAKDSGRTMKLFITSMGVSQSFSLNGPSSLPPDILYLTRAVPQYVLIRKKVSQKFSVEQQGKSFITSMKVLEKICWTAGDRL